MKRLALLLGSLLVVSAAASAKEVVPAPVVVEEAPVQVVEKEVIVYRDKEEGFRPNGYLNAYYRYYGETEGQDRDGLPNWNTGNKYSKMEMNGAINMTEKQSLEYRVRVYNELDHNHNIDENGKTGNEVRLRYYYDHGVIGDSKVGLKSRVHYNDDGSSQELEYQAQFNFAEYLFNNDFVKTTDFTVAPLYRYTWSDKNEGGVVDEPGYDNALGIDFTSSYDLPWGFSAAFNLYAKQHFYSEDITNFDGSKYDKDLTVDMELYLYYTANLYTADKYTVDFKFEGGYDDYSWSQEKFYGKTTDQHSEYELYALPHILTTYNVTDEFSVYLALGAEYRNFASVTGKSASNWRWQPTAWAGFNVAF